MARTLADRVRDFSEVKLHKTTIKVPKLKVRTKGKTTFKKEEAQQLISSMVNILLKAAIEKSKKERKKKPVEEEKSYKLLKDDRDIIFNGGYGTVSKSYGSTPRTSYLDYGKLFSHLGSFKAKQPYENMAEHLGAMNKAAESSSFTLVDSETLQKGGWHIKYFYHPGRFDMYTALTSLVSPIPGISSAEWEKFKLLMIIDKVAYNLKISTS